MRERPWRTLHDVNTLEPVGPIVSSVDISTRPRVQRVASGIELGFSILCFGYGVMSPKFLSYIALGSLVLWDAVRVLSWKLEITPEDLRVRRYFLWRSIPWAQIRAVGVGDTWGRGQKAVRLTLASQPTLSLGAFGGSFALAVRDGLQAIITRQRDATKVS
jgi:hypothetical protein